MANVKKVIRSFHLALMTGLLLLGIFLFFETRPKYLEFYAFDIGQGDALFIRTPAGHNILIDGGPDNAVVYKLGRYLPFYDRRIDLMILSHPHADHLVGLVEVLKRYQVKNVISTGVDYYSPPYLAWLDLIKGKNINITNINKPLRIFFNDNLNFYFLFPNINFLNKDMDNLNNASVVFKAVYGDTSIILTGDYEDEELLVGTGLDLKSDILKVGHHGSDNANSRQFLEAVSPEHAVISAGAGNKFNHPHQATIDNLRILGVEILRTDILGDIHFKGDGKVFWLE